MSDGEVICAASYEELLASSREFLGLVNAHKEAVNSGSCDQIAFQEEDLRSMKRDIDNAYSIKQSYVVKALGVDQWINQEEKERGNGALKPYLQYLNQNRGFFYASLAAFSHVIFVVGQILQNSWLASNVQNPEVSESRLISVYLAIGFSATIFLLFRSTAVVVLGLRSSKTIFSDLLKSLFRAPILFFETTPVGRVLSRVTILVTKIIGILNDLLHFRHQFDFPILLCRFLMI